jgi:hypothetical protein
MLIKMLTIKTVFAVFFLVFLSQFSTAQTVGLTVDKLKTGNFAAQRTPQYMASSDIPKSGKSLFFRKNALKVIDNQSVSCNKPKQIPSVFSVEALPFFCKIEYKMGLNKSLPIKFRLGDVQYVDELEGKH